MSEDVLTAPNILEYPYTRTVGPVMGRFFTSLREGRIEGIRTPSGKVVCPPTEYDPWTSEPVDPESWVEVGPGGTVVSWAWVTTPHEKHPLRKPFAWALVRLDGADTAMVHVVDAGDASRMHTGMRVRARLREERVGEIKDIECFVPEEVS